MGGLKRFLVRYWFLLFVVLVVLAAWWQQVSLSEFLTSLLVLNVGQVVFVLTIFAAASCIHVASRKFALASMNESCGFRNLLYIHFSSLAAHYSTPVKIGFPLAIYLMNRLEQVDYSKGTALLMLELVASTWLCGLIAMVGMPQIFGLSAASAAVVCAAMVLVSVVGLEMLLHFGGRLPADRRLGRFIAQLLDAIRSISTLRLCGYLLLLLSLRFLDGFFLYFLAGFMSEGINLWQATVASSGAFFVGSLSMVPMGLGTRDATMLVYLQTYGIADGPSIAIVTLQRILSTGISFVLGLIFASVLGIGAMMPSRDQEGDATGEHSDRH